MELLHTLIATIVIPLLLTADEDEAMAFAEQVKPDDGETEKAVLTIDAKTPCTVCVYRFIDGKLCTKRLVQDFTR